MKRRFHKCSIDGREYLIPEYWLIAAVRVRTDLGSTPNEATADAIRAWDKLKREEAERERLGEP